MPNLPASDAVGPGPTRLVRGPTILRALLRTLRKQLLAKTISCVLLFLEDLESLFPLLSFDYPTFATVFSTVRFGSSAAFRECISTPAAIGRRAVPQPGSLRIGDQSLKVFGAAGWF